MAAVRDVLPWSIWPIVPMLTCGLVRSNFFLASEWLLLSPPAGSRRASPLPFERVPRPDWRAPPRSD